MIKQKVHPIAKQMGYKSNEDFYNDFPTQEHYEKHMANGGMTPQARDQWNQSHQGVVTDKSWDHNVSKSNAGVAPMQQEFRDWSSGSAGPLMQKAVSAPNGLSKVDDWEGYQTGAYKYRPLQIVNEHHNAPSTVTNYGTNYEQGIADNNAYIKRQAEPAQWQSNDQGIPMPGYAQAPTYTPPNPGQQAQQDNWHTGEATDYSVDAARTSENMEFNKGGKIYRKNRFKKGTGDLIGGEPIDFQGVPPQDHRWDIVGQPENYPQIPQPKANPSTGMPVEQPQRRNKTAIGMGITLNTAPLIAGADMLVTTMYNSHMRANEANLARANAQKVQSPNNFIGGDMLTYAQGGMVDDFTTHPNMAKEEIEGGEGVQLPSGQFDVAQGPKHSEGGIPTNLPPDTRVYSDQIKADKEFVSDITDGKIRKKMTIADLAKKYSSKKEDKVLASKTSDAIAKRTATLNTDYNKSNLDQIFAYQEMMKNPDAHMMAKGGLVKYGDGGKTQYKKGYNQDIYDDQTKIWNEHPDLVQEAYKQINPATGQPYGAPKSGIQNNIDGLDGPRYRYTKDYVAQHTQRPQEPKIEQIDPQFKPIVSNPTGPRLDDGSFYSPWDPGQLNYTGELPDLADEPSTKKKRYFNGIKNIGNVGNVSSLVPGAMAAINAMTDFPINNTRFTPEYVGRPEELNIDPVLNRNLAMAKSRMSQNTGNASVDQSNALQTLAGVHEADNQAYGQKFNFDAQSKQAWRKDSVNTKNQAELYNLQRQDDFWNKKTQREANKQAAFQEIANNAFANSEKRMINKRKAQYDANAQALAQQLSPNYHYDPATGFTYVQGPDGQFHTVPVGNQGSGIYNTSDGVRTTIKKKRKSNGQSETTTTNREDPRV